MPLHVACASGNAEAVKLLLANSTVLLSATDQTVHHQKVFGSFAISESLSSTIERHCIGRLQMVTWNVHSCFCRKVGDFFVQSHLNAAFRSCRGRPR